MNFSLSFDSENEQINFKTAYKIVIGKELGGGRGDSSYTASRLS